MRENWRETVSNWILKGLPLFVSVLWIMLLFIPLRSDIGANARPLVGVMCVYFWAVYRPDLFNVWSVFILGVVSDILSVSPMGFYLFLYLVMFVLVTHLAKYITEKNFEILWVGLMLLMPIVLFCGWLVISVYYTQFLPVKAVFFSYLLSVALYPVVGGINALVVNSCLQDDNL